MDRQLQGFPNRNKPCNVSSYYWSNSMELSSSQQQWITMQFAQAQSRWVNFVL